MPATDVWKTRFVNATQQVWYVDLNAEQIADLQGGWPKTKTGTTVNPRFKDDDPGESSGDPQPSSDPPVSSNNANAYLPLWLRSDSKDKPWVVTLDYIPAGEENGNRQRVYDAKLNYGRDRVPATGRGFQWIRAIDDPTPPTNPQEFVYKGNAGRTLFAWENSSGPRSLGEMVVDFEDLRVATFHTKEYFSVDSGVIYGPVPTRTNPASTNATFTTSHNLFSFFPDDAASNNNQPSTEFNNEQRFALYNAPEYVRNPGDMVIAYGRKRIYFIPFSQGDINTAENSDLGNRAQVLNIGLPTVNPSSPAASPTTFSAPLIVEARQGFRMNNVTFSTCSGDGLRIINPSLQSGTPSTGADMYLNNCKFTATGTSGLVLRHTPATKVINCTFSDNEGRAFTYYQASSPFSYATTYEDFRVQNNKGNVIKGCSFLRNGRTYPSVPTVALYDKPSQFWLDGNTFTDNPAVNIHFTGTRVYTMNNTFTRGGTDVGESGVVYTGRSLSNLGCQIYQNTFVDCVRGTDWGFPHSGSEPPRVFYQELACVMLDDAAGGVAVNFNDFSQSENQYAPNPVSTLNYPIVMNGGSYNLFVENVFPSGTDSVFRGFQTVSKIEVDGNTGFLKGNLVEQIAKDFYPIPDGTSWQFDAASWTTPFATSAGFGVTSSNYYGADWVGSSGNSPYTWVTGTPNVPRLREAYWFTDAARKARWFVPMNGSPGKHFLKSQENHVFVGFGNATALALRVEGHINDPNTFPGSMTFQSGTWTYVAPPTPVF